MAYQEAVEPKKKKYLEPVPKKQDAKEQKNTNDDLVTSLARLTTTEEKFNKIKYQVIHVIETKHLGSYKTGPAIAVGTGSAQAKLMVNTIESIGKEHGDLALFLKALGDKKNQEVINNAGTYS
jgi:hypothetical protein